MATSMYWLKLYMEILNDPDLATLDDHTWRRFIEFLCLAKLEGKDGLLPTVQKMAWSLRTDTIDIDRALVTLAEASKNGKRDHGLVHKSADGWMITRFAERQKRMAPAEKQSRYRDRQREAALRRIMEIGNPAARADAEHELAEMGVEVHPF